MRTAAPLAPSSAHSAAPPRASAPLRDASTSAGAPRDSASQRAVSSPSPPVPPVSSWVLALADAWPRLVGATNTTTLPTFLPLCSSRKAASHPRARSKVWAGSPCNTPAAARRESRRSTRCIHGGSCCMSLSIASTSYRTAARACRIRAALHTPRLPISSKVPPSPSSAVDAEMKSSDKLLSTTAKRPPQSARAAPRANAAPPRDELSEIALGPPWTAPRPTPPAAVWTSAACPRRSCAPPSAACTVLHVIGSVHADSKESETGLGASNAAGPRATLARLATLNPSTATPVRRWAEPRPACRTTPAQSPPGGPGSPGYSPSTLITSRKLRPTARTCVTCGGSERTSSSISESPSGAPKSGWASSFRLAIAPRDGSRSCKRPWRTNGSGARRGTRARTGATYRATSGSATPAHALSARSAARGSAACKTERCSNGASCRTQRAKPSKPACGAWRGASALRMAERSTSRAAGAVAMRVITHSTACSIGSGSRLRCDAARRTSTPSVPPMSMGATDDGSTGVAAVVAGSAPSSNTDEPLSLPADVASSHRVWYIWRTARLLSSQP
eukprot:scaffold73607_cov68-Phaeocystis_antarctica.AAC.1